jgi:hypothetical protein
MVSCGRASCAAYAALRTLLRQPCMLIPMPFVVLPLTHHAPPCLCRLAGMFETVLKLFVQSHQLAAALPLLCAGWRACLRRSWTGSSRLGTGRAPSLQVPAWLNCGCVLGSSVQCALCQHVCWVMHGRQHSAWQLLQPAAPCSVGIPRHGLQRACASASCMAGSHQMQAEPGKQWPLFPPRSLSAGATQRSAAEAAYFEPLAEIDPEDHRSPPLFPGR